MIKVIIWWVLQFAMFLLIVFFMNSHVDWLIWAFFALWVAAFLMLVCANCGLPIWLYCPRGAGHLPMPRLPSEKCSRCGKHVDTKS
jgi:hypothetical protein